MHGRLDSFDKSTFRVGFSGNFLLASGEARFPFLKLDALRRDDISMEYLPDVNVASADNLKGLDAFLTMECTILASSLRKVDTLQVVGRLAAGYDDMAVSCMTDQGISYVNVRRAYSKPVATAALTLLLNLTTRLGERERLMKTSVDGWAQGYNLVGTGLHGLTLGILGPGEIGQEIMRLATPLGMRMIATGGSVRPELARQSGFEYVDLDDLFRLSNVVIIACPLTDNTRECVTRDRLFSMRKGSFLVNVGRGQVIDEAALIDSLESNHLAGAGLDVFYEEPVPVDNPLLSMENVVVSPHGLAMTDQALQNAFDEVAVNIIAALDGEVPENLVNPDALKFTN